MRILLDECVPRPLAREIVGHDIQTIHELGWNGKKNGDLLALMETAGFDVLLTVDQNLQFQQNLAGSAVAVLIMNARSNRLTDLAPMIAKVLTALATIQRGEIIVVYPE